MDKYEVIKFKDDEFEMDVNVSPNEETVWLSLNEICLLFDRDKSVISRHIRNVLKEEITCEKQVVAKNATTASDDKTSKTTIDEFEMNVNVSPNEEAVWLTQEQLAISFDKQIFRHIINIFLESELNEKSNLRFLHIAN